MVMIHLVPLFLKVMQCFSRADAFHSQGDQLHQRRLWQVVEAWSKFIVAGLMFFR